MLEPDPDPSPQVHASSRYVRLVGEALTAFHDRWQCARRVKRDALAQRALELLPSPASEKIAAQIRELGDSRVLAAIGRWLDDKEAIAKVHAAASSVPDDPLTQELHVPARPVWGPPALEGPDRSEGPVEGALALELHDVVEES